MATREDELAAARKQMNNALPQSPQPYEEPRMENNTPTTTEAVQAVSNVMTAADFLSAGSGPKYIEKTWASKNKKVRIKKFKKGDLDKISAPLLQKTMQLDLNAGANKKQAINLDINMNIFNEMEKIMVELGLASYVDGQNQPVITRTYIETVMDDDDFKELVLLIKEVNPKAMAASADMVQETADAKN